jgi:hypothetical protein
VLLCWAEEEEEGILTERLQTRLYVAGKIQIGFLDTLFLKKKKVVDFFCDKEVEGASLFRHRFLSGCRSARCFRAQ